MHASVCSATLLGVQGHPVDVEVHVTSGLPGFNLVGQPDAACRESRDRVRAAIVSSGLDWPLQRITVNLAPSGTRKGGSALDLPIAIGLLAVTDQLPDGCTQDRAFLGELGLDGAIRSVPGAVPLVAALDEPEVIVGDEAHHQAAIVPDVTVRSAPTLKELVRILRGDSPWPRTPPADAPAPSTSPLDLADVRGLPLARRAVEVAAAGGHHLLLVGPPGSGKTMLARRLPALLPPLPPEHELEASLVHSAAGLSIPPAGRWLTPPLREPHHSASVSALVGGGSATLRPGEISLAHRGVLFLDELAEFPSRVLDCLRQPLEDGRVRVVRAAASAEFPARFLLVAATNPCPCGGSVRRRACTCDDGARSRYLRRISGPLLDRFDLRVRVEPADADDLMASASGPSTADALAGVNRARQRAGERGVLANADLDEAGLIAHAPLDADARALLGHLVDEGRLSGRGVRRIRSVALTVADLAGDDPPLTDQHLAEAIALRTEHLTGGRP